MKKLLSIILSIFILTSVILETTALAQSNSTEICHIYFKGDYSELYLTNRDNIVNKGDSYSTKLDISRLSNGLKAVDITAIMGDGTFIKPTKIDDTTLSINVPVVTDDIYICVDFRYTDITDYDPDVPIYGTSTENIVVMNLKNVKCSNKFSYGAFGKKGQIIKNGAFLYQETFTPENGFKISSFKIYRTTTCYDFGTKELIYTEKDLNKPANVEISEDGSYRIYPYANGGYYIEAVAEPIPTEPTTEPTTKPTVKPVVKATSVSLNASSVILNRGKKTTLRATVAPSNATNKKIAWTTSNSRVATVTQSGVVTAKSKGTAYIKASALDGSKKYRKCKVTVKQPVTSVRTSITKKALKVRQSFYIKASAYPASANVKTVAWSVNRKGIVKLSGTATYPGGYIKVTALKRGTVYLKATAKDGSRKYGQCKIIVR